MAAYRYAIEKMSKKNEGGDYEEIVSALIVEGSIKEIFTTMAFLLLSLVPLQVYRDRYSNIR